MSEHREAVTYDLAVLGIDLRDLGTDVLPWWRLAAILQNLPLSSATARAVHGEKTEWSAAEHLLASILDVLQVANWQRGGGKGSRPQPTKRPGVADGQDRRKFGTARMTLAEARRRWSSRA